LKYISDTPVQSAVEVQAVESQASKMANIMGAFGGMGAAPVQMVSKYRHIALKCKNI
jgi:hypothetical protein